MSIISELTIIFLTTLVGDLLSAFLPLPIPSSIYGILLLFALLKSHILPLSAIEHTSRFLLSIMSLLFIPAGVGLMDSFIQLQSHLAAYLLIALLSTIVVLLCTGITVQSVIRHTCQEDSAHE